jgi:predicted nucleic acid-binding protein
MPPLRVYVDSSVFGGYFESEFAKGSRDFFELVREGRIIVVVSDFVIDELRNAPERVQALLKELPPESRVRVAMTVDAVRLCDRYLAARILGSSSAVDAMHVALATVIRADAIVSWNFRHIVHVDKMRRFNQVNVAEGFGPLTIVSPNEVRLGDDEQE